MMEGILTGILTGVIVGVIMLVIESRRNKQSKEREAAELESAEKDGLMLDLLLTVANLTFAIAGTLNATAEVEECVKQGKEALEKFRTFERKQITKL